MKSQIRPALSVVSRGYAVPEGIALLVAPRAEVDKREFRYSDFSGGEALVLVETRRGAYSDTKEGELSAAPVDAVLEDHDFAVKLSKADMEDDEVGAEQAATRIATDVVLNRLEKRVADIIFDLATYPSGSKTTLSGSNQWSHADSDPVKAVIDAVAVVQGLTGKDANTLVLGYEVYTTLQTHPKVRTYLADHALRVVTADVLAAIFGVKRVLIGKGVWRDRAGNQYRTWGKSVAVLHVNEAEGQVARFEPTFMRTFMRKGYPYVDSYDNARATTRSVRANHSYLPKVIQPDGGYLFNAAVA